MERYKIGRIVNAVGLKGEVKVYNYSDYKERFEEIETVFVEDIEYRIMNARYMKDVAILKLEGVDDRNGAEALRDKDLYIPEEMLRILPEDTYYIKDLIGIKVTDPNGQYVGIICDVLKNNAQDLYEIELENKKKFLLPAVEEFVLNINMEEKTMKVKLIEGLLDL